MKQRWGGGERTATAAPFEIEHAHDVKECVSYVEMRNKGKS